MQSSRECTQSYLSTGISNLLQPAQAEVVLGQLSTYLASLSATAAEVEAPSLRVSGGVGEMVLAAALAASEIQSP